MAGSQIHIYYYLGVALIVSWFMTTSYLCYFENKAFSEEMQNSYKNFYSWSDNYFIKMLSRFSIGLPSPSIVNQWKTKIAYAIGHIYLMSSFGLLAGLR